MVESPKGTLGYVDLHAHFLPALDDGSPDDATTLAMVKGLAAIGYEAITATPHQKAAQFLPSRDAIAAAYATTGKLAAGHGVTLHIGAENYWDHVFFERTRDLSMPCYDDGRAFLFEIPVDEIPLRLEDTLFELRVKRLLPVMAHPERYRPYWDDLDRLATLGQSTALVVDLGAVAGYHGARPGKIARRLLEDRIAHAAASDIHAPSDLRTTAEGIAWIKKRLGAEAATRLLGENPRRILAGELPDP